MSKGLLHYKGNPVHNGHVRLMEEGLKIVDQIDVYVSRRQIPQTLPHEIRVDALEVALESAGIRSKVNLIISQGDPRAFLRSIGPDPYNYLLMGSNVANMFNPEHEPHFVNVEREHFCSFPGLLICRRPGFELSHTAEHIIHGEFDDVTMTESNVDISSTEIRRRHRESLPYDDYLPNGVSDVIRPHMQVCFEHRDEHLKHG